MPSCLSIFTFTYSLTAPIIHRNGYSGHSNRAHAHVPCQRKKAYALAEQRLLIICRGLVFKMETMIVQFVCVGGGRSMPSFYFFLTISPLITQSTQVPHVPLKNPFSANNINVSGCERTVCIVTITLTAIWGDV